MSIDLHATDEEATLMKEIAKLNDELEIKKDKLCNVRKKKAAVERRFVKKFRHLPTSEYKQLSVRQLKNTKTESGTLSNKKRYFSWGKVPLFAS